MFLGYNHPDYFSAIREPRYSFHNILGWMTGHCQCPRLGLRGPDEVQYQGHLNLNLKASQTDQSCLALGTLCAYYGCNLHDIFFKKIDGKWKGVPSACADCCSQCKVVGRGKRQGQKGESLLSFLFKNGNHSRPS